MSLTIVRLLAAAVLVAPLALFSQSETRAEADSLARLRIDVQRPDERPLPDASVSAAGRSWRTDSTGRAALTLAPGAYAIVVAHPEFRGRTVRLQLHAGQDTTVTVRLEASDRELDAVVVSVTRGERRIEDVPLRVEVVDREEIEEKLLMTPGDVAMLLNETAGLRVQATSPALGGAGVRVQGLRARYTLLLTDNLPLHGAQTGGLGLLQIPPMDLERVEVVKGAASALHGAQALGGVINLVSRRPADAHERELLLNQTSRGGSDGVLWSSGPLAESLGYTLLAGAHVQRAHDADGDDWADLPRYRRALVRPRLFWSDGRGSSALLTAGGTVETREGGVIAGRSIVGVGAYSEALETTRGDVAGVATIAVGAAWLGLRGAIAGQDHEHRFGDRAEDDRHRTAFAEATVTLPRTRTTWVGGVAFQRESYRNSHVARFDHVTTTPSLFVQAELDPYPWLALSTSARVDAHEGYATFVHPRVGLLIRAPDMGPLTAVAVRLSAGTATFAPTPFVEETEAVGLAPLQPIDDVRVERAATASVDVTVLSGPLELVTTLFGSEVRDPVVAVATLHAPGTMSLVNSPGSTRTAGSEVVVRYREEPWHVTASYTFVRSTELDPITLTRRVAPLVPRQAAGVVGMYELEERGRLGVELYYTGRQPLDDDPFRDTAPAHLIVGALGEWHVGGARLFLNFENLTNVRQTRWSPLVRPTPGLGGRPTTDVWTELSGRTINGGVRLEF